MWGYRSLILRSSFGVSVSKVWEDWEDWEGWEEWAQREFLFGSVKKNLYFCVENIIFYAEKLSDISS